MECTTVGMSTASVPPLTGILNEVTMQAASSHFSANAVVDIIRKGNDSGDNVEAASVDQNLSGGEVLIPPSNAFSTKEDASAAKSSSEVLHSDTKLGPSVNRIEDILLAQEKGANHKTIDVFKEVEAVIDLGSLYLHDMQPVDSKNLRANAEVFLNALARDNAQLLFNKVWQLPIDKVDNVIVCHMPAPATVLPREKKIPKPKPPTKWEIFAASKGIKNKKRGRMIFDEESKTWKPRFGYKRGNDDTNEWCLEVPDNADPNEDQFEKRVAAKKERVAKNELQRLQNIKNTMEKNNGVDKKKLKEEISKDIDLAKVSTASLGKFQANLPKEKENKKRGKKRTFASVAPASGQSEKDRALEVWNKLNSKKPALDLAKGVNKKIAQDQQNAALEKKKSGKVKNQRFRKGAQAHKDKQKQKKKFQKGRTLGKTK